MKIGVLKYFLGVLDTDWTPKMIIEKCVQLVSETPKKYFRTPIFIDSGHPPHLLHVVLGGKQKKTKKSAAAGKSTSHKPIGYSFFKDLLPFEEEQQLAVLNRLIETDYDISEASLMVERYRRERYVFFCRFHWFLRWLKFAFTLTTLNACGIKLKKTREKKKGRGLAGTRKVSEAIAVYFSSLIFLLS